MELKEVKEFIEQNADNEEVQSYVKGFITPDGVKKYIESDEGAKIIQPKLDQHFTKSLETWKTNNLDKLINENAEKIIAEKYPEETEEQKRIRKLETDLANESSKRARAEMLSLATSEATKKGLPSELVKYFLGKDEESTQASLQEFEKVWKSKLDDEIANVFKKYGRKPELNPEEEKGLFTREEVQKMSQAEVKLNRDKIHKSMKRW